VGSKPGGKSGTRAPEHTFEESKYLKRLIEKGSSCTAFLHSARSGPRKPGLPAFDHLHSCQTNRCPVASHAFAPTVAIRYHLAFRPVFFEQHPQQGKPRGARAKADAARPTRRRPRRSAGRSRSTATRTCRGRRSSVSGSGSKERRRGRQQISAKVRRNERTDLFTLLRSPLLHTIPD